MAPSANEGGAAGASAAGASTAGSPSELGGDAGASPAPSECVYRLDVEDSAGGAGGAGGESGSGGASDTAAGGEGGAAAVPTITKATSRLIGDYLTDAGGRALYVFGADLAGDCKAEPVSACEGDCLLSWPIFHAESRLLGAGVDAAAFGSFRRADGTAQTTYYGWPLYYYANDSEPGDITGHGSGVWGAAELVLPNVVVRRSNTDRFLADGAGWTLYAFAGDTLGTASSPPESACSAGCSEQHPPFSPRYVGAISTLEPRDFTSFVRGDGTTQVAYKGAPLYHSSLDDRPGAVNGAEDEGFSIVLK